MRLERVPGESFFLTFPGVPSVFSTNSAFILDNSEEGEMVVTVREPAIRSARSAPPCSKADEDHLKTTSHFPLTSLLLANAPTLPRANMTFIRPVMVHPLKGLPPSSISLRCHGCRRITSPVNQRIRFGSTQSAQQNKLPPHIPSAGSVNLSSLRGLVALHGPDAAKFLQGLITKIFPSETEPTGMFTSFLTPQVPSTTQISSNSRDESCLMLLSTLPQHPSRE